MADTAKCCKTDWNLLHGAKDPQHGVKATQEFINAKKWDVLQWSLNPKRAFLVKQLMQCFCQPP